MIIVGGANGAGKTTFIKKYLEQHAGILYLSADAIAETLSPQNMDAVKIQAGRVFTNTMKQFIHQGVPFLVESTLAGKALLRDIDSAKDKGLETQLIYIFHDSMDVCINRVRDRVLAGGHGVPAQDIIRRYKRSLINFWCQYKDAVDEWYIVYNSSTGAELVASGHKPAQGIDVVNKTLFSLFEKVLKNERG